MLLAVCLPLAAADWKLVWSDEFDKDGTPDPSKWTYEEGMIRNRELQYYTADRRENARVEGGHLVVEARRETWRNAEYTSFWTTSMSSGFQPCLADSIERIWRARYPGSKSPATGYFQSAGNGF